MLSPNNLLFRLVRYLLFVLSPEHATQPRSSIHLSPSCQRNGNALLTAVATGLLTSAGFFEDTGSAPSMLLT